MFDDFISEKEEKQLVKAIEQAELNTSGEIRIHIEKECNEDVLDHSAFIFEKLGMHKTDLRNGVLIYLAYKSKKIAIIGDVGINNKIPTSFWDETKNLMLSYFRKGEYAKGLCQAVENVGKELKKFFPYKKRDTNELPNTISFGKQ